ncbi:hypothetical protein ACWKWU_15885 [Chitinophaga lutea]
MHIRPCYVFLAIALGFLAACAPKTPPVAPPAYTDSLFLWGEDVILYGDTVAFGKMTLEATFHRVEHWSILYYAQLMCNKYNYAPACLMAYEINADVLSPSNRQSHDSVAARFGRYYLLRAYELGDLEAGFVVKKVFPEGAPKAEEYLRR